MEHSNPNQILIDLVRRQLNSGSKQIVLPAYLVAQASDEVLEEIRRWCKLNNASVEVAE